MTPEDIEIARAFLLRLDDDGYNQGEMFLEMALDEIERLRADQGARQRLATEMSLMMEELRAENEKLKRIEEAAFKYWNDVKDPMPSGAELYEALKAYRNWK